MDTKTQGVSQAPLLDQRPVDSAKAATDETSPGGQIPISDVEQNGHHHHHGHHGHHHGDMAPHKPDYRKVWVAEFRGPHGSRPDLHKWNFIVTEPFRFQFNNEKETYTNHPDNAHLTGDGELAIVPKKLANPGPDGALYSSARLECKESWHCEPGEKMIFQAEIKLGEDQRQLGIWPAFWALGESGRRNPADAWPVCGEWDIMELVNGQNINHGTVHFSYPSTPTTDAGQDVSKFSRTKTFNRDHWHTWAFRVNRTPNPFQEETLTWLLDGKEFFQVSGATVGDETAWKHLAHSPFYPILNVAVGGSFPDGVAATTTPVADTQGGLGVGMKVRYVAVYKSGKHGK